MFLLGITQSWRWSGYRHIIVAGNCTFEHLGKDLESVILKLFSNHGSWNFYKELNFPILKKAYQTWNLEFNSSILIPRLIWSSIPSTKQGLTFSTVANCCWVDPKNFQPHKFVRKNLQGVSYSYSHQTNYRSDSLTTPYKESIWIVSIEEVPRRTAHSMGILLTKGLWDPEWLGGTGEARSLTTWWTTCSCQGDKV